MNLLKKAYCRSFQTAFKIALPFLPYRTPRILNKIDELPYLLFSMNIKSVLLVTDAQIRKNGITSDLEKLLEEYGIKCTVYDKTQPNPTVANVEEARLLYVNAKCEGIIAFGGGSSMDCAKGVGIRIARPNKTLSLLKGILKVRKIGRAHV